MISMKQFAHFLTLFSIVCLLVLSVCGAAAADYDLDIFQFDLDIYSEIDPVTETSDADGIDEIELDIETSLFRLVGISFVIMGICLIAVGFYLGKKGENNVKKK